MKRIVIFSLLVGLAACGCAQTTGASEGTRIESVAEITVNEAHDLITIAYTDEKSVSGNLYLAKKTDERWTLSYGAYVLDGLSPVVELSGDAREKYIQMLIAYCDRIKGGGGQDMSQVDLLLSILHAMPKMANQALLPTPTSVTDRAAHAPRQP